MSRLRFNRNVLAAVLALSATLSTFADAEQAESLDLATTVSTALSVSLDLKAAQTDIERAEEQYRSTQVSSGSEYDLEESLINLDSKRLKANEARSNLIINAVSSYLNVVQSEMAANASRRQLEITIEKEATARLQWEQGVKTEEQYLDQLKAKLNAELALAQREDALESAQRSLLRLVNSEPDAGVELETPILSPAEVDYEYEALLAKSKAVSSGYSDAERRLSLAERKLAAYRRLATAVTSRELEDLERALEASQRAFAAQEAALEDKIWGLLGRLAYLEMNAEAGARMMEISDKKREIWQQRAAHGLITDIDVAQYQLGYDNEVSAQAGKAEEVVMQLLRIAAAAGDDLLQHLEAAR